MDIASESIQSLAAKVESLGFDRKDLSIMSFDIDAEKIDKRRAEIYLQRLQAQNLESYY